MVHVNDERLHELENAFETSGQDYKAKLASLTILIEEITSGDIQGDPANDLLSKYQAKQDVFNGLLHTIEDAENYMGIKGKKFDGMLSDLKSTMK